MAKTKIKNKRFIATSLVIALLIIAVLGLINYDIQKSANSNNQDIQVISSNSDFLENIQLSENTVVMKVPAIDEAGKGTTADLIVELKPGTGKTLVDIDSLLFWADTQQSIRVAKNVAQETTGKSLSNYDIVYKIYANASIIGGPSAGSALTIATIAVIENKKPKSEVMITGSINRDGSLGPVGDIIEKAKASKEAGATIFLVPLLQSREVIYETSEHCEKFGMAEICTTETKPKKVDIKNETGVDIIEVENIQEAENYFF
ncbi:hypothetical protein COV15_00185 [Candidatus Woesearchaeota archaeon CG10_big_fil_rev_8_21_14_0_10_34_12]|nr:MAG: hypothetical protein COV15_00185 [Candidatus Woesearchaeota archaeon CG10_big_fil_rev_8_21_14_0_10_34_12]